MPLGTRVQLALARAAYSHHDGKERVYTSVLSLDMGPEEATSSLLRVTTLWGCGYVTGQPLT